MTSRTTPVGILVIALVGLFAMGCNAQTGAVFDALVEAGAPAVAGSEGDPTAEATAETVPLSGWWVHQVDGYAMELPPGWSGAELDRPGVDRLLAAVASTHPGLTERMEDVLGSTRSRVSAVAGDPSRAGEMAPVLLVLAQPRDGRKGHEIRQLVKRQIGQLPGIGAQPVPAKDAGVGNRGGWRFDYSIADPDLGVLVVRSYVFRLGPDVYAVNLVASETAADDAEAMFDEIAESLRFGW